MGEEERAPPLLAASNVSGRQQPESACAGLRRPARLPACSSAGSHQCRAGPAGGRPGISSAPCDKQAACSLAHAACQHSRRSAAAVSLGAARLQQLACSSAAGHQCLASPAAGRARQLAPGVQLQAGLRAAAPGRVRCAAAMRGAQPWGPAPLRCLATRCALGLVGAPRCLAAPGAGPASKSRSAYHAPKAGKRLGQPGSSSQL